MRTFTAWIPLGIGLLAGLTIGCGSDDETNSDDDGSSGDPPKPAVVIDLVVDASRDGVANAADPVDQDHQLEWSDQFGASFLVNIDDDDLDKVRDFEDDPPHINGDADLFDMARFLLAPWPEAPDGSLAVIDIVDVNGAPDGLTADNVRVWVHGLDGNWYPSFGAMGPCGDGTPCTPTPNATFQTNDLRAGLEFAIEGRRFRESDDPGTWNGELNLRLTVLGQGGQPIVSETNPTGTDQVKLRVAPWILFGNLSPFDQPGARVWSSDDSAEFVAGIKKAANTAGIEYSTYGNWGDQWTQDFFQTAYTVIPVPGGGVHGMRVANARPWGRSDSDNQLPIVWLNKNYLGPDHGTLVVYDKPHSGDSYDSHGNHDLIPPYENNGVKWPMGRIFHGSGVLPETQEFYASQSTQGPAFSVKTSWLAVGHIDEVFSYVPAATPRGWKLLVASADLMRDMLEEEQAKGNGSVLMFENKKGYIGNSLVDFERTIDQALADEDIMAWSNAAQSEIDGMLADLRAEVGLTDDEIIYIPVLFEDLGGNAKVAWNPGTVNMLVFGDYAVIPKPFGPQIGGSDIFEKDLLDRLGTPMNALGRDGQGMKVYFTDDWYTYHILLGEVHCGSNPEAPAPYSNVKWWETGR